MNALATTDRVDLAQLMTESIDSPDARLILADYHEQQGRLDVAALCRDELPTRSKTRKRVDKMTAAERDQMAAWAEKWIEIGLRTGKADRPKFEAAVAAIYRSMEMRPVPIVWVPAPICAPFAGCFAALALAEGDVRSAVHSAVDSAVDSAVHSAVRSAVHSAVDSAVDSAVHSAVDSAVDSAVHSAVCSLDPSVAHDMLQRAGYRWIGGQFWPGWYWGSAYVTFMLDVLRLDIGRDLEIKARAYAATVESACYWYPTTQFVIVSERPTVIERGKLARWDWFDDNGDAQSWEVES